MAKFRIISATKSTKELKMFRILNKDETMNPHCQKEGKEQIRKSPKV